MMGTKTLAEVKVQLVAFLNTLPGKSPEEWLRNEMEAELKRDPGSDVRVLETLLRFLCSESKKRPKAKRRQPVAK